jgi:hypothetical protein
MAEFFTTVIASAEVPLPVPDPGPAAGSNQG